MTIHESLRQLRANRGMTQEQVAAKLGVTRQALSSYESGRTRPDIDTLLRLSEIYDTDLESLLHGQDAFLKTATRINRAAGLLTGLLTVLTLISSSFLWSANYFFPLHTGQLTSEELQVFQSRQKLITAWETADQVILALSLLGFLLLLVWLSSTKHRFPLKRRLIFALILSALLLLCPLPFALTDPVHAPIDYLITPLLVIGRLLVFLCLHLLIEVFRRRNTRPGN